MEKGWHPSFLKLVVKNIVFNNYSSVMFQVDEEMEENAIHEEVHGNQCFEFIWQ